MTVQEFLKIPFAEVGITEWPSGSNCVKYNDWYYGTSVQGDAYPWCMAFTQWCFMQAGLTLPYKTASCSQLLNWYQANHPERVHSTPQPGDIMILKGHTGIVYEVQDPYILTVEGNTSPSDSGSQYNGGCVAKKRQKISNVVAFIRPVDWDDENKKEVQEEMTQEKFNEYMDNYLKQLAEKAPGGWSEKERTWCEQNGIIKGGVGGAKMYKKFLTREEMAVLVYRLFKMVKKNETSQHQEQIILEE